MKFYKVMVSSLFLAICLHASASEGRKAFREAKQLCAKEVGVSKPENGAKLSKEDKEKIKACLTAKGIARPERKYKGLRDENFKTAMKKCQESTGVKKPGNGQKRSDEDKAKVDACLVSKGILLKK